jgi:2-polyprenyl-3-methyl-5-hydroxy-6-metoxy-1,4-benzoquinol methylase
LVSTTTFKGGTPVLWNIFFTDRFPYEWKGVRNRIYHGSAFYDDEQVFDTYRKRRQKADNPNDTLDQPIFLQLLGRVGGKPIPDLGCGDGRFGLELLQRGCKEYHGVDGSKRMIEQASQVLANHPSKISRGNS